MLKLTMLLFVVYTLLRPHVSTTNFNNNLAVYTLTPTLTRCLMVLNGQTLSIIKVNGALLVEKHHQILKVNLEIPEVYGNSDKRCWLSEE